MKKAFFTLLIGFFAFQAFAQEQAVYSQYQILPVLINPGYTGFEGAHQFIANARSTWTGFPGRPNTYTLMYNGPVGDKLALGGGIFSEKLGDVNLIKFQLNYAFRFRIQKARIGIGLSTDFLRKQVDTDLLGNPLIDRNDEVLENMAEGQSIFDASVGMHMLYDEKLFVSLSLPNTIRARLDEVPVAESNNEAGGSLFQYYVFQIGYVANMPSQTFKIVPSIAMRKFRDVPYQIDLNVQGRFLEDKLIAGLTFRPNNKGAAAFMIGTKFNVFQLFYSYDVAFSPFQQYSGGSHELSVAFSLAKRSPKKASDTPPAELYQ